MEKHKQLFQSLDNFVVEMDKAFGIEEDQTKRYFDKYFERE